MVKQFSLINLIVKKDEKVRQQKVTPATLRWSRSITYAHLDMQHRHIRVYIYTDVLLPISDCRFLRFIKLLKILIL